MRVGILILGVFLVIFGLYLYTYSNHELHRRENLGALNDLGEMINEDYSQETQFLQFLGMLSIFIIFGGVISIPMGLVIPSRAKQQIRENHKKIKLPLIGDNIQNFINKENKNEKINSEISTEDDSLKILNMRYAKGEITKEEYEQIKKDIEK